MAKKSDKALVKRATGTALEGWEQKLADEAKDERAQETMGIPRITHRGGEFKIDGKSVGRSIKLAVVDYIFEKTYYAAGFDPNSPTTPDCYAFIRPSPGEKPGETEGRMVAHDASPHKQHLVDGSSPCRGCPHNEWNTAEVGRGKRCKDNRRLLVIAPTVANGSEALVDEQTVTAAEVRQLSVPPASLKNWGDYLTSLRAVTRTGNVREAIVQIDTFALENGGHGLKFTPVGAVSKDGLQAILQLRQSREGALMAPYPVLAKDPEEQETKVKRNKIREKMK